MTTPNSSPLIAVTPGDPAGIGPEVAIKALQSASLRHPVVLLGKGERSPIDGLPTVRSAAEALAFPRSYHPIGDPAPDLSFACVRTAVSWAVAGDVGAVVTAPISKETWRRAGLPDNGHTGYLARASGSAQTAMMFWSEGLKVLLFTIHVPLREVAPALSSPEIISFLRFADRELRRLFHRPFRFLVAGLNPHAGEGGYLGNEEEEIIAPALEAVADQIEVSGPLPPDAVFLQAQREGPGTVVLCWYHDQGLIPFKLLHRDQGVNLTLGLPFVRTSPDHGTACDIAGKGIADPRSMIAALTLADSLLS